MKLYRFSSDEINTRKCGYCNWETEMFYWLSESTTREKALEEITEFLEEGLRPLCASCMADLLVQGNYEISRSGSNISNNIEL